MKGSTSVLRLSLACVLITLKSLETSQSFSAAADMNIAPCIKRISRCDSQVIGIRILYMVRKYNSQNLISNSERTPSERKEQARKAGIASGAARRAKKPFKLMAEELSQDRRKLLFDALIEKAEKGSLPHLELYLELAGEHPKREAVQASEAIDISINGGDDYAD